MSGGAAMGRKGAFYEREVAAFLTELTGFVVERRLREGRIDDIGDLDGLPGCVLQVKAWDDIRKACSDGLVGLARQQAIADAPYGALLLRRLRQVGMKRWVAVLPLESFATLLVDAIGNAEDATAHVQIVAVPGQ